MEDLIRRIKDHKIELNRWDKGLDHHPKSEEIMKALEIIDTEFFGMYFDWRTGGDGDNGESLMFELDVYFELLDKEMKK